MPLCGFILDFGGITICYSLIFRRRLPHPPPKKNQGWENIARFGLRAASSLIILGNGSLLFHFFDPQNPNHFTLTVFAGSKFVKERWCACLLHLYHNTTGNEEQVAWALKSFPCLRLEKQVSSLLYHYLLDRVSCLSVLKTKKKILVVKIKGKYVMTSTLK